MREADLYPPVKAYLEAQGYEVKSEIGACDVVAMRGDEPPVIVELKLTFSLGLVFQAIERQTLSDAVYMAVPVSKDRGWKLRYKDIVRLCKRLGLGLLAVDVAKGTVQAHVDPMDHTPRKNRKRQTRLLREFERRSQYGRHHRHKTDDRLSSRCFALPCAALGRPLCPRRDQKRARG